MGETRLETHSKSSFNDTLGTAGTGMTLEHWKNMTMDRKRIAGFHPPSFGVPNSTDVRLQLPVAADRFLR